MPDPTLLYCVGATKAGTSWLYRHLHDHPSCKMRAVKEAHYWDTFNAGACDRQVVAFENRLVEMRALLVDAAAAGRNWQVKNVTRRIGELESLIDVLQGDRTGDLAYAEWLLRDSEGAQLVADMTPSYAALPDARIVQMLALSPMTRVVFLIRDPIDRLWSHVRMQAKRQKQDHEEYTKKANNILWRIVNAGKETHITDRGDYPALISKLQRLVPAENLLIAYAERMFTPDGLRQMSRFLGIDYLPAVAQTVHSGQPVVMRDDLRPKVAAFLKDHYEWVAQNMGPLPDEWQDNYARAIA